ncbi:ribbon-helix-helix domain-containing protein [Nitrincola iocasae]|uniref:CopG-like ribbon-helix-helix domain-containing protein n=1 Tax=Nitrincola iocasae TaxID=2614693 RepID=A0A5J6LCT8_9GAMM|nr:hypothetical protein [Nitrincola iocasae]QEW06337.1 hypothetical protein F5I99_07370 [Nitrincola iocasae]
MPQTNTTTQHSETHRPRRTLQVVLPVDLIDAVTKMANDEDRSRSSMGARLIQEAIESRKS